MVSKSALLMLTKEAMGMEDQKYYHSSVNYVAA